VVISDTHFGPGTSTLSSRKMVDYLIWELWRYGEGCDEIVLLGDILDLWRARPEKAVRDASYFMQRLSEQNVRISYVIGNHDHHLMIMNQESDIMERAARGETFSVYLPNMSWYQTIHSVGLEMYYPVYTKIRRNRRFIFTHGHHLNGVSSFPLQLVETIRCLSGESPCPADLERMMAYAYESIYRSSYIGEMAELEERLWKISSVFDRVKSGILKTLKFTPVERQYDSIMRFICDQKLGPVDCFVYGDTHRAGIYRRDEGPLAVNTGCFTGDARRDLIPDPEEIPDTYLVLSDLKATVRQLGRSEPIFVQEI